MEKDKSINEEIREKNVSQNEEDEYKIFKWDIRNNPWISFLFLSWFHLTLFGSLLYQIYDYYFRPESAEPEPPAPVVFNQGGNLLPPGKKLLQNMGWQGGKLPKWSIHADENNNIYIDTLCISTWDEYDNSEVKRFIRDELYASDADRDGILNKEEQEAMKEKIPKEFGSLKEDGKISLLSFAGFTTIGAILDLSPNFSFAKAVFKADSNKNDFLEGDELSGLSDDEYFIRLPIYFQMHNNDAAVPSERNADEFKTEDAER